MSRMLAQAKGKNHEQHHLHRRTGRRDPRRPLIFRPALKHMVRQGKQTPAGALMQKEVTLTTEQRL